MSDPRQEQSEPDELGLDAETVTDLEPGEDRAARVGGGWVHPPITWSCPQPH